MKGKALLAIGVALTTLGTLSGSLAQFDGYFLTAKRTDIRRYENVCWGEYQYTCRNFKPTGWQGMTEYRPCGTTSETICPDICGVPYGPQCGVYSQDEWTQDIGKCETRLAAVICYNGEKIKVR